MLLELLNKFESSTITQSLYNDHFIIFDDNYYFDNVRVILMDLNLLGSSISIRVRPVVHNFGSIAASMYIYVYSTG